MWMSTEAFTKLSATSISVTYVSVASNARHSSLIGVCSEGGMTSAPACTDDPRITCSVNAFQHDRKYSSFPELNPAFCTVAI